MESLRPVSVSPIGIANLPDQRHKIVTSQGLIFTIMVVGESGLGKTTFINTLLSTTIKNYANHEKRHSRNGEKTVEINITKAELEENSFKVHLTVVDTPGFGDHVDNRNSWIPVVEFLEDQHESYMLQEQQPHRLNKVDLRVHACLYFIRPSGHSLNSLDIETMKRLGSRVNLIPVLAKADTFSSKEIIQFKSRVRAVIEAQGISIYQPSLDEGDGSAFDYAHALRTAMPFSVIGSENDVQTSDGRFVKGRSYSWGVAEVESDIHCDFKRLRSMLIRTHMLDLIDTTNDQYYENYRALQIETTTSSWSCANMFKDPKFHEAEEALKKRFREQVKLHANRFRSWEQNLIREHDRLDRDLEPIRNRIKELQSELNSMQSGTKRSRRRY